MSELSISTETGNTYNLASRGYVQALVEGHNHDTSAHNALFSALDKRVEALEEAESTSSKNPSAIEIRDSYGDILSRINADLTVVTPTKTRTLLTSDDYKVLTERDDLNTARVKAADEKITALTGVVTANKLDADAKFASVATDIENVEADLRATDSRLNDKIDIKIGEVNTKVDTHIAGCEIEHTAIKADVNAVKADMVSVKADTQIVKTDMTTLKARVSQDEETHAADIERLEGLIGEGTAVVEQHLAEEVEARKAAVAAEKAERITAVAGEKTERIAAVDAEKADRIAAVSEEATARASGDSSLATSINNLDSEVDTLQNDVALQNAKIAAVETLTGNLNTIVSGHTSNIATLQSTTSQHSTEISNIKNVEIAGIKQVNIRQDESLEAHGQTLSTHTATLTGHTASIAANAAAINKKQDEIVFKDDFLYTGTTEGKHSLELVYGTVTELSEKAPKGKDVYTAVTTTASESASAAAAVVAEAKVDEKMATFVEDTSGAYIAATSGSYCNLLKTPVAQTVSGDVLTAVNKEFAKFIPTISFVTWDD